MNPMSHKPVSQRSSVVAERGQTGQTSLTALTEAFSRSTSVRAVCERISGRRGSDSTLVAGQSGSAVSFLIDAIACEARRPIVFIASEPERSFDYYNELRQLRAADNAQHFPSWGIAPWEFRTPTAELVARRIAALDSLSHDRRAVIVTTLPALFEPTITRDRLRRESLRLVLGEEWDMAQLADHMVGMGFRRVPNVEEVGDFALRGGLIDFFSPGAERPVRVEFFGDTIETIREFEVTDQRSVSPIDQVALLPRREAASDLARLERGLEKLTPSEAEFLRSHCVNYPDAPGLEWLASIFALELEDFFAHVPSDAIIIVENPAYQQELAQVYVADAERRRAAAKALPASGALHNLTIPHRLLTPLDEESRVEILPFLRAGEDVIDLDCRQPPAVNARMDTLAALIDSWRVAGVTHALAADNPGQAERLKELLADNLPGDPPPIVVGAFHGGFFHKSGAVALLVDHEIFHREFRRRRRKRFKEGVALTGYDSLVGGDYIVHVDHGVGRYLRLESLAVDGRTRDCLLLLYADDDRVYVPVEEFHRVSKYAGKGAAPALNQLGGTAWEKAKERASAAITEMAKALAHLYAERKARPGFAFSADGSWMRQLESSFAYDETEDQLKAIDAVKRDMESSSPMDRLICGDVGFGKTEVAVRAALKCVHDGKQVAVLAPTTVLTQQHVKTFRERLAEFPVRIAALSRFQTKAEQAAAVAALAAGELDIIIGTHRLLSVDVTFRDLGLFVIDEEQRFGVKHKECLRALKATVDTLTLTATPIPRTLQLSLSGARDMSIIASSPRGRLPITTVVSEFTPEIIAEATLREIDRGGQVFFVHNRVQTIDAVQRYLHKLLPQVTMLHAHGQMPERELERVMLEFVDQRAQVLLCTAIIESGLDLPNVNTILIDRADRFGMSQLYQLRGRVGRSPEHAYCYLLTPSYRRMTEDARKRLKAIEAHTELGSGFALAMLDLEIRGAGNLLGVKQSGYIDEIGFDMYTRMLDEAVVDLKQEQRIRLFDTKLDLDVEMRFPEEYIDINQSKVDVYRRLSSSVRLEQVDRIREELIDRYGRLPEPAENLLAASGLKILAAQAGLERVRLRAGRAELIFHPSRQLSRADVETLRKRIDQPMAFSLSGAPLVTIQLEKLSSGERVSYLRNALVGMSAPIAG